METNLTNTNESFAFLTHSSDFLNIVLNNINSCVLLLDKNMILKAFNDSLKTIFTNKKDENLQYRKCGEAIGCAYQIQEAKDCGKTSKCHNCELRVSALTSYMNNKVVYKKHISKPFINYQNKRINKHLQFSTRLFLFNEEKYIIMIIEDITNLIELKRKNE